MTPNRDLSELFRQQASKVQERPGPSVWRRLSRRLDTHERWNKVALRISTQVVLFFLLLLAIIGPVLIGVSIEEQRRADLLNPPVILEILSPQDTLPEMRRFLTLPPGAPGDTIQIQLEN